MFQRSPQWQGKPEDLKSGLKILFHSLHQTQQNFMTNRAASYQQLNSTHIFLNFIIVLK